MPDNVVDLARPRGTHLRLVEPAAQSAPPVQTYGQRLRASFVGLIAPDRMRVAAMTKLGPGLSVWVADAIDLVDIDFAEEQLTAALKAVREERARTPR